MTKVDIFSGFLGAGKTTLIKKLIKEAYGDEKLVLIENEFGEIGVDGGFLKDTGIKINEMDAGCICCSLVGDFGKALEKVISEYDPDRILIEPSGVGKLSDVIIAVSDLKNKKIKLNGFTTVVDAKKIKMYMNNFGEFYNNQIEHASSIILSHIDGLSREKLDECVNLIREHNKTASLITTKWEDLTGKQILDTMEKENTLSDELDKLRKEAYEEEHHHHHHHHHEDEECHDHHHHHEDEECHDHHHHHHEDEECCEHHNHHHHHHHAEDVFDTFGAETTHKFEKDDIIKVLNDLEDSQSAGMVLRAKGIIENVDGSWIHFDYVPGEIDVRKGTPAVNGMICVIGAKLDKEYIRKSFGL